MSKRQQIPEHERSITFLNNLDAIQPTDSSSLGDYVLPELLGLSQLASGTLRHSYSEAVQLGGLTLERGDQRWGQALRPLATPITPHAAAPATHATIERRSTI